MSRQQSDEGWGITGVTPPRWGLIVLVGLVLLLPSASGFETKTMGPGSDIRSDSPESSFTDSCPGENGVVKQLAADGSYRCLENSVKIRPQGSSVVISNNQSPRHTLSNEGNFERVNPGALWNNGSSADGQSDLDVFGLVSTGSQDVIDDLGIRSRVSSLVDVFGTFRVRDQIERRLFDGIFGLQGMAVADPGEPGRADWGPDRWEEEMSNNGVDTAVEHGSENRYRVHMSHGQAAAEFVNVTPNWQSTPELTVEADAHGMDDFAWVESDDLPATDDYDARLVLPSTYDTVYRCEGTQDNPDCTPIPRDTGERPYYTVEDGQTVLHMNSFSGGGGEKTSQSTQRDFNDGTFNGTSADRDDNSGSLGIGYLNGSNPAATNLENGLIGYWRMDRSGEASDSTGVDGFEDGDTSEYTDYGDGDLSEFSVQSSVAAEGDYALSRGGGATYNADIFSTSGLDSYPEQGDTFEFYLRSSVTSTNVDSYMYFGVQDESDFYCAELDMNDEIIILAKSTSSSWGCDTDDGLDMTDFGDSFSISPDTWYRVEVEWDDGSLGGSQGDINVTVYDADSDAQASAFANDNDWTDGGIGWATDQQEDGKTTYFDGGGITSALLNVTDYSGNGRNGTTENFDGDERGATGVFGTNSFDFDGTDDAVTVPNIQPSSSTLTVSAWVRKEGGSGRQGVSTMGDRWDDTGIWWLGFDGDNAYWRLESSDDTGYATSGDINISDNQWTHIAGSYDGTTLRVYVDGVLDTTYSPGITVDTSSDSGAIGAGSQGTGDHFTGKIDEVRVHDRALSESEIEQLYFQGVDGTFEGNHTQKIDMSTRQMWQELEVDATLPSGTDATGIFRALDSGGNEVDRQQFTLTGGSTTNYSLNVQDSEDAEVILNGTSTDVENTWEVHSAAVYSNESVCAPPNTGDWFIQDDCTVTEAVTAPGNVFVDAGNVLNITAPGSLTVDLQNDYLLTRRNGSTTTTVFNGPFSSNTSDMVENGNAVRWLNVNVDADIDPGADVELRFTVPGQAGQFINVDDGVTDYLLQVADSETLDWSLNATGSGGGGGSSSYNDIQSQSDFNDGTFNGASADRDDNSGTLGIGYLNGSNPAATNLENGLLGYWRLDRSSGDVLDYSGNGHHAAEGDIESTVTRGETGVFGTNAIHQDASGANGIEVADASEMNPSGSLTISAWVNFHSDNNMDDPVTILSKGAAWCSCDDSNYGPYMLGHYSTGIRMEIYDPNHDRHITSGDTLNQDQWYHVVGTWDGSNASLYVDGELVGSNTQDITLKEGNTLYLGGEDYNNDFDGYVDEVRIYDRGMSPEEVRELYFMGRDGTFNGNYTTEQVETGEDQTWDELQVDATSLPSGTDVTAQFQAMTGGTVDDTQVISLGQGESNYSLNVADSEDARVILNGTSTDVENSWAVGSMKIFAETGPGWEVNSLEIFHGTDGSSVGESEQDHTDSIVNHGEWGENGIFNGSSADRNDNSGILGIGYLNGSNPAATDLEDGLLGYWRLDSSYATGFEQPSNQESEWYCIEEGENSMNTCTTNATDTVYEGGQAAKIENDVGLCGWGGLAKDVNTTSGMDAWNMQIYVQTEPWGQGISIMVKNSSGRYTLEQWNPDDSSFDTGWLDRTYDLSNAGTDFSIIVGNEDEGSNCGNTDHGFTAWFDEVSIHSNTVLDYAGTGRDGTLEQTEGGEGATGVFGTHAFDFGGENDDAGPGNSNEDYIDLDQYGDDPAFDTSTGAVSFWAKDEEMDGTSLSNSFDLMMTFRQTTTEDVWRILDQDADNDIRFDVRINDTWEMAVQSEDGSFTQDTWHHVVVQQTGNRPEIWIDGVNQSISPTPYESGGQRDLWWADVFPASLDFRIADGGDWVTEEQQAAFNGSLDEIRMYDRPLSEDEIQQLYFHGQDGTFDGNYTWTVDGDSGRTWNELKVDASVSSQSTDASVTFQALSGEGGVLDTQQFSINDGFQSYPINIQDSEDAAVILHGTSSSVTESWEINNMSLSYSTGSAGSEVGAKVLIDENATIR